MSTVSVRAHETELLLRSRICAKSGLPADSIIEMRVVHTPAWIWVLLFFGILPLVIAYAFTKKEINIEVPATRDVAERRKRISRYMLGSTICSVLLIASGAVLDVVAIVWLGAAGIVGVVMALPFSARAWITARYDGDRVHLSRLHPNYVAALGLNGVTS